MSPKRPEPISHLTGKRTGLERPRHVSEPGGGGKFTPDGEVLAFPGNTIVCHINPISDAHAALERLQKKIKNSQFGHLFAYLPPASFHMTVFEGRSPFLKGQRWPDGVSEDSCRDEITAEYSGKLSNVVLPQAHTIRPAGLFALHSLTVCGFDDAQEKSLRRTREVLRDATGFEGNAFSEYVFHISLAYPLRWVSEDTAHKINELSETLGEEFAAEVPYIELGPCELCNFDDMFHFEPVRILDSEQPTLPERV